MELARLKNIDKKIWWFLAVVILLVTGVVFVNVRSQSAGADIYDTVTVERGTLTASVGASGTVRARQVAILTWQADGRVEAVAVKIGDSVESDQVLASLDQSSLSQAMVLGQANLISAQYELENVLSSNLPLAQAQQNLAAAKQSLDDAQYDYDRLNRPRVSDELIEQTADEVTAAQNQLNRIEWIYNRFYNYEKMDDDRPAKAELTLNLLNIRNNLNNLVAKYNWYTSFPDEIEIEKAKAALGVAKAQLEDAQREVDRLENGQNAEDIAAAQARVNAALSTLNLSKITAPFNGVITEANPQSGDQISQGDIAFRVEDLNYLYVDLEISEVDINTVVPDQLVTLIFDAIPEKTYTGKVVKVNLAGEIKSGSVVFPVTVALADADGLVKPGMTAAVTITVREVQNVLLISNRAVRVVEGERVVYVLKDGQPVIVKVRLGTTTDLYSEVVGGDLKEGDLVVLNPPLK